MVAVISQMPLLRIYIYSSPQEGSGGQGETIRAHSR